ncbi:hypothetical protein CSPAE12_00489, partial [Colletotrichum incanum]
TEIKDRERLTLLEFIKAYSVVTDMPYTYYFRVKTAYRFSKGSSYCRSYVKAKKPCDSVLEWDKKEEAAGKELLRLHEELT